MPPDRYKPQPDWTPGDHLAYMRSNCTVRPETDEYIAARKRVLEAAGLEHEAPASDADIDPRKATVEQHIARSRARRSS